MVQALRTMVVAAALAVLTLGSVGRADEEKIPLDKVPKAVLDAVKAKYPAAELKQAEKEEEKGKTIYEIELKDAGRELSVSLTPAGKIVEIEKRLEPKELPQAVSAALKTKYPQGTIKKAEEITEDDKVSYEVIVVTADKKRMEVELDRSGKILSAEEDDEKED